MVLNFNFNIINNILYLTLINAGQVKRGELKSSGLVAGYLAGTWRWKAAGPLVAGPGDTADIFRLEIGCVK